MEEGWVAVSVDHQQVVDLDAVDRGPVEILRGAKHVPIGGAEHQQAPPLHFVRPVLQAGSVGREAGANTVLHHGEQARQDQQQEQGAGPDLG